uniref:BRCT domain-containing protein n=1 Tax=Eutreptiella gymnastica TaxID=73025 RepID=A0A6T2HYL6_9EUGL
MPRMKRPAEANSDVVPAAKRRASGAATCPAAADSDPAAKRKASAAAIAKLPTEARDRMDGARVCRCGEWAHNKSVSEAVTSLGGTMVPAMSRKVTHLLFDSMFYGDKLKAALDQAIPVIIVNKQWPKQGDADFKNLLRAGVNAATLPREQRIEWLRSQNKQVLQLLGRPSPIRDFKDLR